MKLREHEMYIFFKNVVSDIASAMIAYLTFFVFLATLATIVKNTGLSATYIVLGSFVFVGSFLFFHAKRKIEEDSL